MNMSLLRYVGLILSLITLMSCAVGRSTGTLEENGPVTVVATDFGFAAPDLVAQVGRPMTVVLQNNGRVEHDWTVLGLGARDVRVATAGTHAGHGGAVKVHVAARAGEHNTLVFTPSSAGTYEVVCTVLGHKEAGMRTTLTVSS